MNGLRQGSPLQPFHQRLHHSFLLYYCSPESFQSLIRRYCSDIIHISYDTHHSDYSLTTIPMMDSTATDAHRRASSSHKRKVKGLPRITISLCAIVAVSIGMLNTLNNGWARFLFVNAEVPRMKGRHHSNESINNQFNAPTHSMKERALKKDLLVEALKSSISVQQREGAVMKQRGSTWKRGGGGGRYKNKTVKKMKMNGNRGGKKKQKNKLGGKKKQKNKLGGKSSKRTKAGKKNGKSGKAGRNNNVGGKSSKATFYPTLSPSKLIVYV